jgi:hypothetical protein
MSIYTYVPGRSELVELMIDHVYEESTPSQTLRSRGGHESNNGLEKLANLCRASLAARLQHGSAADWSTCSDVSESVYAALHTAGFTAEQENVAITNLHSVAAAWRRAFHDQRRR